MLSNCHYYAILTLFFWIEVTYSKSMINRHSYFMDNSEANSEIVDIIVSKGYLPHEKYLPKTSLVKSSDDEVTYLLSKLTDEELIKLLTENNNKNEYDLNEVVKLASDSKFIQDLKMKSNLAEFESQEAINEFKNHNKKRFRISEKQKAQRAVFRLDNKQVDPYNTQSENNKAIQISNILHSQPIKTDRDQSNTKKGEKELLFDILVSQLKTLWFKQNKAATKNKDKNYQPLPNDFLPSNNLQDSQWQNHKTVTNEKMFVIINDEIKSNGSSELISVDPDTLEKNSSVLLLGSITTPLTDSQLKSVMLRISTELSKPEYVPLLLELSGGILNGNNIKLMKNFISGPKTRRYIKPHRCNYQSRLAKIYGGPKWLLCTGYINLNTPSLYD